MEVFQSKNKIERKKLKPYIYQIIKILLFGIILIWLQKNVTFLNQHYKSVSMRLEEQKINREKIEEIEKDLEETENETIKEMIPWKIERNIVIENPILEHTQMVSKISVYGSMQATIPMELVAGNYAYYGDHNGCVIDKNTAHQLFGTINIIGNEVKIENKSYWIRGVVKAEQNVFLFQNQDKKEMYDKMEIIFSEDNLENGLQLAESLVYQYNIGENTVFLDGILYANIMKHYEAIPYWILYLLFLVTIMNVLLGYLKQKKWSRNKKKDVVKLVCFIIFSFVIVFLTGFFMQTFFENPCYLPQQWIPTQWSDFDFWVKKYQDTKEHITEIQYIMPNIKDMLLMEKVKECIVGIGLSVLCSIHIIYKFHMLSSYQTQSNHL